jgi:hypothetical protein
MVTIDVYVTASVPQSVVMNRKRFRWLIFRSTTHRSR